MTSRILTRFAAMTFFAALAIPLRPAAQVAGSGTTSFIPKWTGNTTLGNSKIVQSGGKVGVGTSSPDATLGGSVGGVWARGIPKLGEALGPNGRKSPDLAALWPTQSGL